MRPTTRPRNVYVNFNTPWDCFRQKLPSNPTLAPGSAAVVSTLATQLAQDQYTNLTMNFMPVVVVPVGQALVPVTAGSSNLPGGEAPVPAFAQTIASAAADGPMCIVQPSTGEAWEMWQMTYSSGAWSSTDAGYQADAHAAPGSFPGSYGLSASGLAYSGVTITEADVHRGYIDHAIGLTVAWATYPPSGTYWPPAVRYDSGDTGGPNAPVEGMLLTWKAGTAKPSGLTPIASMVFDAIATYGAYVMDVTTASNTNPNQGIGIQFEQTADWAAHGAIGTDPITTAMGGQANYDAIAPLGTLLGDLQVVVPPVLGSGAPTVATPSGLAVGAIGGQTVALSWTAVTGAVYYLVEYSSDSGSTWTLCGSGTSPATWPTTASFTVDGLVGGTAYEFRVWAMGANGSGYSGTLSAPCASVSATTTAAPVFSAETPPSAVVSVAYSYTFAATGSPTFAVGSGTLPAGLSLSSAGVLSGTPTTISSSTFTVTASSATDGTSTTTPSITLKVLSALTVPAVTNASFGYGGTLTPALPSGWAANDVCYAFTDLSGTAACETPTGWTLVAGPTSNQFTTSAVFRRVLVAGDAAPTWTDPDTTGSEQFDVGYVIVRNADTTTPEDVAPVVGTTYGGPPTMTVSTLTPATLGAMVLYYVGGYLSSGTIDTATSQVAYTESNAHEFVFYEEQTAIVASASALDTSVNQPNCSYAVIAVRPA